MYGESRHQTVLRNVHKRCCVHVLMYVCVVGGSRYVSSFILYTLYIHTWLGGSRYVKGVKDGVKTWEVRHPTLCECIKYKDG